MALAIEIELLAGRYAATRFNDRGRAEWPPHPARLFSAAVALWAEAEPRSTEEEDVLRWLERQPAPEIACSDAEYIAVREGTTHFVPVNDASAAPNIDATYAIARDAAAELARWDPEAEASPSARHRQHVEKQAEKGRERIAKDSRRANERKLAPGAIEVFPDTRGRQARAFPSIRPDDPRVVYLWPAAAPGPARRAALDGLLARIGRLGHSASLVSCRVTDEAPRPAFVPDELGSSAIRVLGDGQLDLLEDEFARHQGNEPRALPAAMQPYAPFVTLDDDPVPGSVFSPRFAVLEVDASTPVSLRASLALARALRTALLESAGDKTPEMLSGRGIDARTGDSHPTDRAHAAIVPLPFVGHPHADGGVRGIAFVAPVERGDERDAALQIVWAWLGGSERTLRVAGRDVTLRRATALASLATIRPVRWCRPSDTWATATPIALDRWPGDLGDADPARRAASFARAEEIVARACAHIGLPEPERVAVRPDAFVSGVPPAHRFPPFRTPNGGPHRPLVHACVTFGAPVCGPVLLGAGRYVGQGLCFPLDSPRTRQASGSDES
jgi:CRISPR-associated protein Csb2